jgi:hypothetical protein
MISFGAGINSVAMTIMLVKEGWRGPIVFADTGGEWPETYCYLKYFERDFLKPQGLNVTVISPATHSHLYDVTRLGCLAETLEKYCLMQGIIPLLSVRWCTIQFKRVPLELWRKANGIDITCIGISASEPHRERDDPSVRYPLIEQDFHRGECGRIIRRAGLEVPIKSGCFFCPGQNLANWRRLYHEHPDLYARAIALEDNASGRAQKWVTLDSHGISLRQHAERRWRGQMRMDLSEWMPCLCKL